MVTQSNQNYSAIYFYTFFCDKPRLVQGEGLMTTCGSLTIAEAKH